MKILCIKLPKQRTDNVLSLENVAYELTEMMVYAEHKGAITRSDWELLDENCSDFGGDAAILTTAYKKDPTIILFSLFDFNLHRSMWIAHRLRSILPGAYLVATGPEALADMPVFKAQIFDSFLEGQIGAAFIKFLIDAKMYSVKPRYHSIATETIEDLINPYLAGALCIKKEKPVLLGMGTGSSFSPIFNTEGPKIPAYYNNEYIASVLKLASKNQAEEAILYGQYIDERPDSKTLLKALAAANNNGVALTAWFKADCINEEALRLLEDASFVQINSILASVSKKVLDTSNIKLEKKAFERGARLCWSRAIMLKSEVYLPLPYESYESCIETFDYLGMLGIGQDSELKPVPLTPGSRLRTSKNKYGIKDQLEYPPYWVSSTEWMEDSDIINAIADFEDSFDLAWAPLVSPSFLATRGAYISFIKLQDDKDIDILLVNPEKLASSVTILIDMGNDSLISRLLQVAENVCKENPYNLWQLVFYSNTKLPKKNLIDALRDAFHMPVHYYELSRIFSMDIQASYQVRLFFATKNENLAMTVINDYSFVETIFVMDQDMPGQKLIATLPFLTFQPAAISFEKLYDIMNAYRDYPELLLESSEQLF